jgi:hypothetical protein
VAYERSSHSKPAAALLDWRSLSVIQVDASCSASVLLRLWSIVMRRSDWTPSIVPNGDDQNVYIVVDDFCRNDQAYRETDVERADLEAVIMDMLEGQYQNPVRVVGFNTVGKWSEDVSGDVAHELRRRCDLQLRDVPFYLEEFVERHEGRYHDIQLPLPMRRCWRDGPGRDSRRT